MKRAYKLRSELVDLGSATRETRGGGGIFTDDVLKRPALGLSDD